ncbi:hypothetical protein ACIO3O_03350 [Streptomyces sp. NPDC087440]|uniref:hypothetical protein n=1 Tax=Streptomyces sp. NPDC087440 TaxID=3365790 RepID=UPI00381C14CD
MTHSPRNPYDRRPAPAPARVPRPAVATAAGVFSALLGGSMACYSAYTGIKTFESGFGPIICGVLLLFGLSIARNALHLLAGDGDRAERLTVQLGIIVALSCVAIGSMIAQGDFDSESIQAQLLGFLCALVLSVIAITLCSLRGTKAYVEGRRPSGPGLPPRIG